MAVKIDRHGQAAILSHPEIELLFAEGLQSIEIEPCSEFASTRPLASPRLARCCLRMSTPRQVGLEPL
jgi:hypothetical protein